MAFPAIVRRWFSPNESVLLECRHCGTTLETTDQRCATCGSTEIAVYDVS